MLITGCTDNTANEAPQPVNPAATVETPQTAVPDEAPPAAQPVETPTDEDTTGAGDTPEVEDTPIPGTRRTPEERETAPIDIDLTVLNATMLSAEIRNMYSNGKEFMGKTIRVSGPYSYIPYEALGIQYHYVITKQGDACCQEGFEFIWNGDHVFPDDYPKVGTSIEVDGVFGIYEEDGSSYYYLAIDDIFILG